ncbi:YdcF family protein [Chitiniphilus purpureus]|uniref:YdcF family protein n=1 Tax=Chitiniphilus purpureus TaxID=2981137 RepID=A0ABY6DIN3_9NEIS|nr:YdcF family protein [Chitiniphilus sp. CD1]UXY14210.1 YdcF family protein [Chitiniphilus sp. CD1]
MMVGSIVAKNAIASLLLPPGSLVLLLFAAWHLHTRRPRVARALLTLAASALYLLSTPGCATWLLQRLEPAPTPLTQLATVDAIVVLGGGKRLAARDQVGGETVNNGTLARLRYAAQLARRWNKPLLVTGGRPKGGIAEAVLMQAVLEREFAVPVRWVEAGANDTVDNAQATAAMLPPDQRRVGLVSQAWHLPRASQAFRSAGFTVVPAGTDYASPEPAWLLSLLPSAGALQQSRTALHEMLGLLWYALRGH